jgi:hypothetical protein
MFIITSYCVGYLFMFSIGNLVYDENWLKQRLLEELNLYTITGLIGNNM